MNPDFDPTAARLMIGVILAGGQGRRMGGIDKALLPWRGRTLLGCLIEQLSPHVQQLEINSNRPRQHYAVHDFEIFADDADVLDMGPLAGLLSALRRHPQALLVSVPCDAPILPEGYVERMCAAVQKQSQPLAVAFDGHDIHPTLCLAAGEHAASLEVFLASGQRRARDWLMQQQAVRVDFSDQPASFININHPSDLAMLQATVRLEEEA